MDVLDARAPPAVDGLIIVAHGHDVRRAPGQHAQPGVLDGVGVLKLVHQDVLKPLLIVGEQIARFQPQLVAAQQQLGKVHQPAVLAHALVALVDLFVRDLKQVIARGDVSCPPPLVFLRVDEPDRLTGGPFLLVDVQCPHDALDQTQLIVGIEDLKVLLQPRFLPVHAQEPMGDAVERAHPHGANGQIEQRFDPRAHLCGRLVGEGDGQNAVGGYPLGLDQPGDAMHQDPRLAAARAGHHKGIAERRRDRLPLVLVQMLENVCDVHSSPP